LSQNIHRDAPQPFAATSFPAPISSVAQSSPDCESDSPRAGDICDDPRSGTAAT
jgi:hypothetical protein